MTPRSLYRRIALAEVVTWALLLLGMVLKYVTHTTELGVRVFGLVHGVVFIAFCLVTLLLWVNQRWTAARACSACSARCRRSSPCGGSDASSVADASTAAGASAAAATPRPTRPNASSPPCSPARWSPSGWASSRCSR